MPDNKMPTYTEAAGASPAAVSSQHGAVFSGHLTAADLGFTPITFEPYQPPEPVTTESDIAVTPQEPGPIDRGLLMADLAVKKGTGRFGNDPQDYEDWALVLDREPTESRVETAEAMDEVSEAWEEFDFDLLGQVDVAGLADVGAGTINLLITAAKNYEDTGALIAESLAASSYSIGAYGAGTLSAPATGAVGPVGGAIAGAGLELLGMARETYDEKAMEWLQENNLPVTAENLQAYEASPRAREDWMTALRSGAAAKGVDTAISRLPVLSTVSRAARRLGSDLKHVKDKIAKGETVTAEDINRVKAAEAEMLAAKGYGLDSKKAQLGLQTGAEMASELVRGSVGGTDVGLGDAIMEGIAGIAVSGSQMTIARGYEAGRSAMQRQQLAAIDAEQNEVLADLGADEVDLETARQSAGGQFTAGDDTVQRLVAENVGKLEGDTAERLAAIIDGDFSRRALEDDAQFTKEALAKVSAELRRARQVRQLLEDAGDTEAAAKMGEFVAALETQQQTVQLQVTAATAGTDRAGGKLSADQKDMLARTLVVMRQHAGAPKQPKSAETIQEEIVEQEEARRVEQAQQAAETAEANTASAIDRVVGKGQRQSDKEVAAAQRMRQKQADREASARKVAERQTRRAAAQAERVAAQQRKAQDADYERALQQKARQEASTASQEAKQQAAIDAATAQDRADAEAIAQSGTSRKSMNRINERAAQLTQLLRQHKAAKPDRREALETQIAATAAELVDVGRSVPPKARAILRERGKPNKREIRKSHKTTNKGLRDTGRKSSGVRASAKPAKTQSDESRKKFTPVYSTTNKLEVGEFKQKYAPNPNRGSARLAFAETTGTIDGQSVRVLKKTKGPETNQLFLVNGDTVILNARSTKGAGNLYTKFTGNAAASVKPVSAPQLSLMLRTRSKEIDTSALVQESLDVDVRQSRSSRRAARKTGSVEQTTSDEETATEVPDTQRRIPSDADVSDHERLLRTYRLEDLLAMAKANGIAVPRKSRRKNEVAQLLIDSKLPHMARLYHGTHVAHFIGGRPDNNFILTGEGANYYGAGFYMAEREETSVWYRNNNVLANRAADIEVRVGDTVIDVDSDVLPAVARLLTDPTLQGATLAELDDVASQELATASSLLERYQDTFRPDHPARVRLEKKVIDLGRKYNGVQAMLDAAEDAFANISDPIDSNVGELGSVYTLKIEDELIDSKYFNWDAPMTTGNQPTTVLRAAKALQEEFGVATEVLAAADDNTSATQFLRENYTPVTMPVDRVNTGVIGEVLEGLTDPVVMDIEGEVTALSNLTPLQQVMVLNSEGATLHTREPKGEKWSPSAAGKTVAITGADWYKMLSAAFGGDGQASAVLLQSNVRGTRFLDGHSRGDDVENPTYNYVAYEADDITVLGHDSKEVTGEQRQAVLASVLPADSFPTGNLHDAAHPSIYRFASKREADVHKTVLANRMVAEFGDAADRLLASGTVRIVDSWQDVPGGAPGIMGLAYKDRVYIVAENVRPDEARGLFLHEVGMHWGMQNIDPEVYEASKLAMAKALEEGDSDALAAYELAKEHANDVSHIEAETLAYYLQYANRNAPLYKRVWAKIKAAVKAFLLRQGFDAKVSVHELEALAISALRRRVNEAQYVSRPAPTDLKKLFGSVIDALPLSRMMKRGLPLHAGSGSPAVFGPSDMDVGGYLFNVSNRWVNADYGISTYIDHDAKGASINADTRREWMALAARYNLPVQVTNIRGRGNVVVVPRGYERDVSRVSEYSSSDRMSGMATMDGRLTDLAPVPMASERDVPMFSRRATLAGTPPRITVRALTSAKKMYGKWMTEGGLLPVEAKAFRQERNAHITAHEADAERLRGRLMRAVEAVSKLDASKQPSREVMNQALLGDNVAMRSLPAMVRNAIQEMRTYLDGLTDKIVESRRIEVDRVLYNPESTRAQIDDAVQRLDFINNTLLANKGKYLHRSYRMYDDPDWGNNVPQALVNRATDYMTSEYMQDDLSLPADEARQKAEWFVNRLLHHATDNVTSFLTEPRLGAADMRILKKRGDIPKPLRDLMGEYHDVGVNFAKTVTPMFRLIANEEFQLKIREAGIASGWLFEQKDAPPDAVAELSGGANNMRHLTNLYTTPEIAEEFENVLGPKHRNAWYEFVVSMNGLIKYGKTVISPTTMARNVVSSGFIAAAQGHINPKYVGIAMKQVRHYTQGAGFDENADAYVRELINAGVLYNTPSVAEITELVRDTKFWASVDRMFNDSAPAAMRNFVDRNRLQERKSFFTRLYRLGDDFWKIVAFESEMTQRMKATGKTREELMPQVASIVRNTMPTYSMLGRAAQWLRRWPVLGPFIAFPYEMMRTTYHTGRIIKEDLASGNPELRKLGIRRALAFSVVAGASGWVVNEVTKAMAGIDDDDEDALRLQAAVYDQNAPMWWVGRQEDGSIRRVNMGYTLPHSFMYKTVKGVFRGEDMAAKSWEGFRELIADPFLSPDIGFTAAIEGITGRRMDTGQSIVTEGASVPEQMGERLAHITKAIAPTFAASNIPRIIKAYKGHESESGSGVKFTLEDELMALGGVRVATQKPGNALRYKAYQFAREKSAAAKKLNVMLRSPNRVDEDDLMAEVDRANKLQTRAYRQMVKSIRATRTVGIPDALIVQTLKLSGVSSDDIVYLMRDMVPPYRITSRRRKDILARFQMTFAKEPDRYNMLAPMLMRRMALVQRYSRLSMAQQNP